MDRWQLWQDGLSFLEWLPQPTLQATLALLFTIVLVGHMLVWRRVGGPAFWGLVEYAWLAVASLSLLTALSEYRRTIAQDELPMARSSLRYSWESAIRSADAGMRMSTQRSYKDLDFSDNWKPNELRAAIVERQRWFEEVRQALEAGLDSRAWRRYLEEDVQSRSPNLGKIDLERRRLLMSLRFVARKEPEIIRLAISSDRTRLEKVSLATIPWLLAFALALRITRVAASLRGLC